MRALAGAQAGLVTRAQLTLLGASDGAIKGWISAGYLTRVLPRVYAVGHAAPSHAAELWAAVLYAGPGAMLSHASAAQRRGLIEYPPRVIQVSTPRVKVRSVPGQITVHARRRLERSMDVDIPTTTASQTLLDLGTGENGLKLVRHALAVLDYRRTLDYEALVAACGCGRRGSSTLRAALAAHDPRLALTRSELEDEFLRLCARWRLPSPLVNVLVHGCEVDAYWPEHRLVVELDGRENHSTPAQRRRDHARDVALRAHGISVVRYDWMLITRRRRLVRADLERHLGSARRP